MTAAGIPNIVHYVWMLKDPKEFHLEFKIFISFYSSHIFFRPERIYIHTNAAPSVFEEAKANGDVWTKRILAIPGVTPNYVTTPTSTTKGVAISRMEHQADFIRLAALLEFGGIYMDMDAIPLRDITSLRNSGFANVVGGNFALTAKGSGYISNGIMLAKPHSTMMAIFNKAADEFFDGGWVTGSVLLLTDLANRISAIPSEVLILQPQAFTPSSYEFEDEKRMFKPHFKTPPPEDLSAFNGPAELSGTCHDALEWLKVREAEGRVEKWEIDFSSSYILHATDDYIDRIWGWDHQIDLKYILARQSNFARAVYPAIRHAIQDGVIPGDKFMETRALVI
ncbi:hypothetical protein G7Y89_g14744 [Cudoniella acicularis]|uniref:Uncharacterized protein n=1 Tax=Cudoniella acicularis TaxID=354080 RepID=A0A8H4QXN6_9HELO|nr:hypothetical protein G7Y89_g14744 [Cudoniella acicularis]